jgi:hypothetical protein
MSDNKSSVLIKAFDDRNYTNSERCENGNSFIILKSNHPNIFVGSQISSQLPQNGDTVKISFDVDLGSD